MATMGDRRKANAPIVLGVILDPSRLAFWGRGEGMFPSRSFASRIEDGGYNICYELALQRVAMVFVVEVFSAERPKKRSRTPWPVVFVT